MKYNMEALIHHFKFFSECFSIKPEEKYTVVEAPKGELVYFLFLMDLIDLIDVVLSHLFFTFTRIGFYDKGILFS